MEGFCSLNVKVLSLNNLVEDNHKSLILSSSISDAVSIIIKEHL